MLHVASPPPTCQGQFSPADRLQLSPGGNFPAEHPNHSPEALALVARIEERALLRELRHSKPAQKTPGAWSLGGQVPASSPPLVCSAISGPKEKSTLPPWCSVPTNPTTWYEVFHRDVYLCRSFPAVPPADVAKGTRAAIFEFSDKSRSNLRHVCNNSGHLVKSQFCLTYHETWPTDGHQVKDHLRRWLRVLRRVLPEVPYLWVLEFQTKRGAPHFHVFLGAPRNAAAHIRLAEAWVRITEGTETQLKFHQHPRNWITWKMESSAYVMKEYAIKHEQKEVPAQYHNVGRFWGHSQNMHPVGMIVEPSAITRFTAPGVAQWDEDGLTRFINRTLRRYHEKCMNYNRKTGQKRQGKKRKSPMTRAQAEIPGAFRIPFAAPLVVQIMNYVAENGPDIGTFRRWLMEETPF